MSILRRISVVAAAAVLGVTSLGTAANADFTIYRTDPHVIACWEKVNAYGGVYQIHNGLLNGTGGWHGARIMVNRPGHGLISDEGYVAGPGEWKLGPITNMSIYSGDEFLYDLNGARAVGIPANGIPWFMNHCKVNESPSERIRLAISYGLSHLDALYVGCNAGTYRFGTVAPYTMTHNGASCGQSNYFQPAGTTGFDCSGLIHMMFQRAGVYFPWTSSSAMKSGIPRIAKSQLRVGDLLAKNGHVAMYLGDGNGDGVASVLEATPGPWNSDGSRIGVMISDATGYVNDPAFTAHRVSGT